MLIREKRLLIFFAAAILGLVLTTAGVYAFYTAADARTNAVTVGENVTRIEEVFEPPQSLEAGGDYTKTVSVRNQKSVPCYVRVFAEFSDPQMADILTADWNRVDWTEKQEDGYYYYKRVLPVGEATEPLFTALHAEADSNALTMFIYSESVHSEGFDSARAAFARLNGKEVNKDE